MKRLTLPEIAMILILLILMLSSCEKNVVEPVNYWEGVEYPDTASMTIVYDTAGYWTISKPRYQYNPMVFIWAQGVYSKTWCPAFKEDTLLHTRYAEDILHVGQTLDFFCYPDDIHRTVIKRVKLAK